MRTIVFAVACLAYSESGHIARSSYGNSVSEHGKSDMHTALLLQRSEPQVLARLLLAIKPAGQLGRVWGNPSLNSHTRSNRVLLKEDLAEIPLRQAWGKVVDREIGVIPFATSRIGRGINKLTPNKDDNDSPSVAGLLQAERYIASNRFFVQEGKEAAFEKRWATRQSRLAQLPGFNFFVMLRRRDSVPSEPNYVSFTVWDDKEAFTAWRKGEAFKEAHGGGSLLGVIDMLVSSTQTLKGKPKPAFYDGLLPIAPPVQNMPETVNGWRNVTADGISQLEPELFIAQNRFKITPGNEGAFEQRWQQRESKLRECDGFISFHMLRRDPPKPDDGYNYISTTVWRDQDAFDAWRAQQTGSHGQGGADTKPKTPPAATTMMRSPPSVALYDGILSLYAPDYNAKSN